MTALYCSDLKEESGFPGCCDSCHDDEDMGYDGMLELYKDKENPDRLTHLVCCRVHTWLEELEKDIPRSGISTPEEKVR